MIPSNLTDAELIRLNEYRDDLTELERELLGRLETANNQHLESEEAISALQDELDSANHEIVNREIRAAESED